MLNKPQGETTPEEGLPSIATLREQLRETRQRLDALQAERSSLAIPAVNKKQYAIKRIAEIDTERTELASQVETIEQAIMASRHADPDAEKRNRILAGFERDLPHRRNLLEASLAEKVATFSRHIQQHLSRNDLSAAAKVWFAKYYDANFRISSAEHLGTVEDIYRRLLLETAAELCSFEDTRIIPSLFSDERKAQQRKDAAVKLQASMIAKLIEHHTIKPPADLVEVHALFHNKLKAIDDELKRQNDFARTGIKKR